MSHRDRGLPDWAAGHQPPASNDPSEAPGPSSRPPMTCPRCGRPLRVKKRFFRDHEDEALHELDVLACPEPCRIAGVLVPGIEVEWRRGDGPELIRQLANDAYDALRARHILTSEDGFTTWWAPY